MTNKPVMRKLVVAACLLIVYAGKGQVFPTDTVVKMGPLNKRINFVYLSDGYLLTELSSFTSDVTNINNKLFLTTPFKEYINYFNVFQVRVPSAESGAKHAHTASDCPAIGVQPVYDPKNYFGSRFDYGGIHRLLVPDSNSKINSVLASNLPTFDQAFIVVNSDYYGGSGGVYATSSTDPSAAEVGIHELGHSFGKLADEYWAGPGYALEKPNMTAQSNPALVKWKNWVGLNDVGVYPYVGGPGWYRPVQGSRCKMEVLGVPFCSVCVEAFIERIHTLINPIDKVTPAAAAAPLSIEGSEYGFKLNLIAPIPNTLKVTWKLDGNVIGNNVDTVTINGAMLSITNHTLVATVIDTSLLSKADNHVTIHTYNVQWNLSRVTGISNPELFKANLQVFPNPAVHDIQVKYELEKKANVSVELITVDGKRISRYEKKGQLPGRYTYTLDANKMHISPGMYFVVFSLNGNRLTKEVIKIE
jgi:hypothetical protein